MMNQHNEEWAEKFIELYINGNTTDALKLAEDNYPKYIYKYCDFKVKKNKKNEILSLENLKNDQVWMQTACEVNDPYDSKFHVDFEKLNNILKKI